MLNKELASLGLTQARIDLIAKAAEHERGRYLFFGVQAVTAKALYRHGYAEIKPRYSPEELAAMETKRDNLIAAAKQALCEQNNWTAALMWLKDAREIEAKLNDTEPRITEKGRRLVALVKQRSLNDPGLSLEYATKALNGES